MEKEIWKDIPEYEGIYQISNLGNIKSLKFGKEKILKPYLIGNKRRLYLGVRLRSEKKIKLFKVHQLVAMAFLHHFPCCYKIVIDHKNNNQFDNRLSNLHIITNRENRIKDIDKSKTSSKYIGVNFDNKRKKWIAYITFNGIKKHLGRFETEYEAHLEYQKAYYQLN
jgi:hypothetical protein